MEVCIKKKELPFHHSSVIVTPSLPRLVKMEVNAKAPSPSQFSNLNPFTVPACRIFFGWNVHTHVCKQYIFQSCNIPTFTTAYFCFKSFDMLMPKRKLKDLRFCTLLIIFKWWHCKCATEKGKETVVCMFMFDNQLFACTYESDLKWLKTILWQQQQFSIKQFPPLS